MDEEQLKERERICNLSRNDLVMEFLESRHKHEIDELIFDYVYSDDSEYGDDTLRHELIKYII